MLIKGSFVTEASGSLGGITAARNKGGQYLRARAVPVNPNSPSQQSARTSFASLVTIWTESLTPTQRQSWDTYAQNVPVTNKLGDTKLLSGQNWYIGTNTPRIIAGLSSVASAPTTFDNATLNPVSLAASDAAPTELALTFDTGQDWADENGAALLVQVSKPQNASTNFFKGPFRFADAVLGDSTTAPTSPATIITPFAVTAGQKVLVRARLSRADGRLSYAQIVETIVTV